MVFPLVKAMALPFNQLGKLKMVGGLLSRLEGASGLLGAASPEWVIKHLSGSDGWLSPLQVQGKPTKLNGICSLNTRLIPRNDMHKNGPQSAITNKSKGNSHEMVE